MVPGAIFRLNILYFFPDTLSCSIQIAAVQSETDSVCVAAVVPTKEKHPQALRNMSLLGG